MQAPPEIKNSLSDWIATYDSSRNDEIWAPFTELTDTVACLKSHRDWVEANSWGFGDRAFHYMWYLLLTDEVLKHPRPSLLEIGVYKGQVLSLWALIANNAGIDVELHAISPFAGDRIAAVPGFLRPVLRFVNRDYCEDESSGNLYRREDYLQCVRRIFDKFGLNFQQVQIFRGRSQDAAVIQQLESKTFDLIYIDGGHRYDQVRADLAIYCPKIKPGGYLVLDDASFFQPGSNFWKGHESVSRAAEELNPAAFRNVLTVGHNRVFLRQDGRTNIFR